LWLLADLVEKNACGIGTILVLELFLQRVSWSIIGINFLNGGGMKISHNFFFRLLVLRRNWALYGSWCRSSSWWLWSGNWCPSLMLSSRLALNAMLTPLG